MKLYPFTRTEYATRDLIQLGVDRTQAVREAVGPEIELAIDIRSNLNIRTARRVAQMLEPFDIAWLEEPLLFDNQDAMAALARETKVPIATGEQLYTRWEFRELLEKNVVSIIQPDISHAGGISEVRKIAAMAEAYYVEVCPHCSTGPIAWIASLHLDMCTPNNYMQELQLYTMERHKEMLTNPFEIHDGYCTPPEGPGWGTDLREDLLEKYPPTDYTPVGGAGSY